MTHETIEGPQLAGSVIDEILEDFQGFEFNAGIHGRQYFHSLKDDEVARMIAQIDCLTLSVDDLSYYKQRTCHKVVLHSSAEVIDQMMAYAESLKKTNYTPIRTADIIIECIPPQISKAKAIQALAKQLHRESDQVLTFGDMMNDYEMIRDYVGVAMANADPRLQSCAKYITKSNDEDGVAVFIENLLA